MPHFTTSDGLSLYYDDQGDGAPLVCLAGLTRNTTDFDYVLPYLTNNRLIRLDYRGRGQSEWGQWEDYTIPVEARDTLELLDHLGLKRAAILGTSRGGLIAMVLAATAKHRLTAVALNDIGPEIAPSGLETIKGYIGRNPSVKTHAEAAALMPSRITGFANVPATRWAEEAAKHYIATADGLKINYDPALAKSVAASGAQPAPDLWPLFDAMDGLPLALIRGANSDLLSRETAAEMRARRPDMIFAEVPDRGHIPFLDEPEARSALAQWSTQF
ncbi:alpha/beta fold hydrolase [Oceaniglobus ichthyenteri]|uniref:alpha/beta fold hydrolase n=1 Tax=Oceaniglobus ichthyenteri TaxID=2136177 RepID=UPI000D3CA3F3|nr:alpha/beta hydrolase [Oceaniglobus ichthyenteri]